MTTASFLTKNLQGKNQFVTTEVLSVRKDESGSALLTVTVNGATVEVLARKVVLDLNFA